MHSTVLQPLITNQIFITQAANLASTQAETDVNQSLILRNPFPTQKQTFPKFYVYKLTYYPHTNTQLTLCNGIGNAHTHTQNKFKHRSFLK